jgi:hypothetical protein
MDRRIAGSGAAGRLAAALAAKVGLAAVAEPLAQLAAMPSLPPLLLLLLPLLPLLRPMLEAVTDRLSAAARRLSMPDAAG